MSKVLPKLDKYFDISDLEGEALKVAKVILKVINKRNSVPEGEDPIELSGHGCQVFWESPNHCGWTNGAALEIHHEGTDVDHLFCFRGAEEMGCAAAEYGGSYKDGWKGYEAMSEALREAGYYMEEVNGAVSGVYRI
jgi:hypothetical protein